MLMLSTCIFHNVTYLHELFEFHGIEEILDDNEVDSSWLQVMLHANESIDAPANQRSLSPASPPSSLLPPPSPSALPVDDDKQSPTFGAHEPKTLRQPTGAQPSHPPADDNEHAIAISGPTLALLQPTAPLAVPIGTICDIGRLAGQTQTSLNEDHMVSRTPGNPVWPISVNFNVPPSVTDDTDLVRVMGEHYVRPSFPSTERLYQYRVYDRPTKCSSGCWTTLGRIIGQVSSDTVPPALRHSVGQHMRPLCMTIRADCSRASGLAGTRPLRGIAAGRGTTFRSKRRAERTANRSR